MKRADFVKGIIGFLGLAVLPKSIAVKQYRRIYLLQSFIRGFKFYAGPALLNKMAEGDMLELLREPENEYDPCAIALYFDKRKIGFLPREDNEMLSKLMDAEVVKLQAEITHLQQDAQTWENVHVAVYVLKEIEKPLPDAAKYLTIVETPHYRTLKLSKDKVAHVYLEEDEEELVGADMLYKEIKAQAKNISDKNLQQTGFQPGENLQNMINEGRILVNKNRLPDDLKEDTLTRALAEGGIALNDLFEENGYLVANVNRVAKLSHRIENIVGAFDNAGRLFYEIRFA